MQHWPDFKTNGARLPATTAAGSACKKFVGYANGYRNSTGAAQTITFTTAFANTPGITLTTLAVTVSTTTLTLPISMGAPASGVTIVEGF